MGNYIKNIKYENILKPQFYSLLCSTNKLTSGNMSCQKRNYLNFNRYKNTTRYLKEPEKMWTSMTRYGRYFISVMLGTLYVMSRPVVNSLRKPVLIIPTILGI